MREKHKLEVTFDFEETCDFLRKVWEGRSIEERKKLEVMFELIQEQASCTALVTIAHAVQNKDVVTGDFMSGLITGLAVVVGVSRPQEPGSIRKFLEQYTKRGENVADIGDALKNRVRDVRK